MINYAWMLFHKDLNSAASSCFLVYTKGYNLIGLPNDAATTVAYIAPGSGVMIQNSQCTLNGAMSSVSVSGTTVTITVALSFCAAFIDAINIYALAADTGGGSAGWVSLGTWVFRPAFIGVKSVYACAASVDGLSRGRQPGGSVTLP
jgi:hypothetical protein